MQYHPVLTLGFVLLTGACAFDGGVDILGGGEDDRSGESGPGDGVVTEPDGEPDSDLPPLSYFFATSEDTKRGDVIDGSLVDSAVADGVAEVILAEVHRDEERLEHTWFFESLPPGTLELSMIALPYGPLPATHFIVDYTTDLGPGRTELFLLESTDELVAYSGSIVLPEATSLDLRVKLPNGVPVVDENAEEGPLPDLSSSDEEGPSPLIFVDYLAISTTR